ncbi:hypothetical protein D0Z67_29590 (plasmid) [Streptomyces seoulensis]|uniref:Uncharacterized protein n=1 Tax=Streptomyces seoulensis TaxID=73044 RepID=A0A4P6U5D9_STRSO|nr:hypothetical protein [Streptomyces seoulensis]QBJ94522.1 hypothetical protein D0Z67_29590 [Streptomyces seoulensis]
MTEDSSDPDITDSTTDVTEPAWPPPADPPPPPPPAPDPITWEPQTWYSITFACLTPGCSQQNIVKAAPMFYSNNGQLKFIRVVCAADGCCGKDCTILTAQKLDPQPIEE